MLNLEELNCVCRHSAYDHNLMAESLEKTNAPLRVLVQSCKICECEKFSPLFEVLSIKILPEPLEEILNPSKWTGYWTLRQDDYAAVIEGEKYGLLKGVVIDKTGKIIYKEFFWTSENGYALIGPSFDLMQRKLGESVQREIDQILNSAKEAP